MLEEAKNCPSNPTVGSGRISADDMPESTLRLARIPSKTKPKLSYQLQEFSCAFKAAFKVL